MLIQELRPYVEAGFSFIPLRARSKMPRDADWTSLPVFTFEELQKRSEPDSNFGVRLGRPSKVGGLYLHVLDIDIRKPEYEDEALDKLEELLPDVKWWTFPTVQSGSGGSSRHIYFLSKTAFKSRKIAKSEGRFTDDQGKVHYFYEIEVFGTGKQVVVPGSIHPVTKKRYKWLKKPDFERGLPEIDDELLAELISSEEEAASERTASRDATDLDIEEVEDLLDQLRDLAIDRNDWMRAGMAIEHQLGQKRGWPVFDQWSRSITKKGEKYDRDRNYIDWKSFKGDRHPNPLTLRSLIRELNDRKKAERDAAIVAEYLAMEDDDNEPVVAKAKAQTEKPEHDDGPEDLLRIPGKLQGIVNYYNANNMVEQPQFAVLAALAFGSVVLGRNYRTQWNNYTSMYFLGIGESGAGKEFIRKTVARHLRECGFDKMVGPDDLTSESALFGQFQNSPKLLVPTDEFGKRFGSDKGGQDAYRSKLYAAYLSIYGIVDEQWQPTGFSLQGKSKEEIKILLERWIIRPSPTLLFTSTPSTFFNAIGSGDVKSGFMSRFVIAQGRPGLQRQRIFHPKNIISDDLVKWAKFMACRSGDPDEDMLLLVDQAADVKPFLVPFTKKAQVLLNDIEGMRFEKMVELQDTGLYEILNRARENAMRIALIVALSDESDVIQHRHLEWAWRFVSYHAQKAVDAFGSNLGRSELHLMADKIASMVKKAGADGLTPREVGRKHNAYKALTSRDSNEVKELLKRDFGILEYPISTKRTPFLAPKFAPLKKERPK